MTDIVERLRTENEGMLASEERWKTAQEAANEIERLRAALRNIVDGPHGEFGSHIERREYADALDMARDALGQE